MGPCRSQKTHGGCKPLERSELVGLSAQAHIGASRCEGPWGPCRSQKTHGGCKPLERSELVDDERHEFKPLTAHGSAALPTGTSLGAAISATRGTVLDLFVDNTAGANTVTIAVATNGILSAAAAAGSGAGAGLLTVPSGVTGLACFRIMFSSATAYAFSRIA
jgi:hypothetical protein